MIENLPIEIFYGMLAIFAAMFTAGIVWRDSSAGGVFMFIAGIWLIIIFIPVTSIVYGERIDEISTVNGTESYSYEDKVIQVDTTVKVMIVFFGALICLFAWWLGDFDFGFDSV